MDKETFEGFLKIRADVEAHRMILALLVGVLANSEKEPQKVLAGMHGELMRRLSKLRSEAPMPEQEAYFEIIKSRVGQFFSNLDQSLIETARGRGPRKGH
jgi:hypothetical protein